MLSNAQRSLVSFADLSVDLGKQRPIVYTVYTLMIAIYLSVCTLQAGVKAKKATETYKSYVEKYATAKSEFEQKMAETAQVTSAFVRS